MKRSKTNRIVAGICGGIGEYCNIDPVIIRVIYLLLSIGTIGSAIVIYLILCLIIPEGE